jgi:hypothetical protein
LGRRLPALAGATARAARQALTAVEGRLWPARPKMAGALGQDAQPRAAKRPVAFAVRRQLSGDITVTAGQASERRAGRRRVQPGGGYVVARGDTDEARWQAWHALPCRFSARVPGHAAAAVQAERPVAAPAAGVRRDCRLRRRGTPPQSHLRPQPFRVGRVASGTTTAEGPADVLGLVPNPLDRDAALGALADRRRWAVARCCRWVTCVWGCRPVLRHAATGVRIPADGAILASLLISLWRGVPPRRAPLRGVAVTSAAGPVRPR